MAKHQLRAALAAWEEAHGDSAQGGVLRALALIRACSLDPQLGERWRNRAELILQDCQQAILEQEEEDDA